MKSNSFRMLWIGQSFANLGDVLYIVGLISILYALTDSVLYLAMLPFLNTFGRFLSGMLSPILLNQYRLKSLLVGSQMSKTIVLFGLSILVSIQSNPAIWLIMFLIFIIAFLDGWAMPATSAMLPRLIHPDEIVKANSFVSVITESVNIGGWAVGGIFVAMVTGQYVIWFTFGLFIVSTFMMLGIVDKSPFHGKKEKSKTIDLLKDGWVTIWKNPLFRSIHMSLVIEAIANVVWVAAIMYVYVADVLQADESWWGYLNTAFFIGLLLGGLICSRFAHRVEQNLRQIMVITSFAVSVITLLFGFNSIAWLALLFGVFHGLVAQIKGIAMETYLQKEALPADLPKLYSAQSALISLLFGLSSLLFGAIAEWFNVQVAFSLAGVLLTIGAVYILKTKERFPQGYENVDS